MQRVHHGLIYSLGFVFFATLSACDDDNLHGEPKSTETACEGVSDITVGILEKEIELQGETVKKTVNTVLAVKWRQIEAVDTVKLRFSFENDEWFESPEHEGTVGEYEIPVLGVPELTDVSIQIVGEKGGKQTVCETSGKTGALPKSIPRATLLKYDPSTASDNRWMLGTVEKTPELLGMYEGVFTLYIVDRQGRIVWYYLDQAFGPITAYPRIARDGASIYFDRSTYLRTDDDNTPSIARTTLDFRQFEQIDAPSMTDSMDITDDGGFVYNSDEWVIALSAEGKERKIWSCTAWLEETGIGMTWLEKKAALWGKEDLIEKWKKNAPEKIKHQMMSLCYANSVVWNPADDTILLSFPYLDTVVEVSRQNGELLSQWGQTPGSWRFEPETIGFEFEHGANITKDGTLLVSTHEIGIDNPYTKPPHYFIELALDRENQVAKEIWRYGEGLGDWPACKGEVFPVEGGNRLVNYGSAGIIREVTKDGEVAWDLKWDADFVIPPEVSEKYDDTFTDDDINNMVGHNILIDDLYELTKGWEEK